jgi:hypothetical protein
VLARNQRFMTDPEQPRDLEHALKCELAAEVLRSSGRLRLQVTGWSMFPTIWPGDTLELERTERDALSTGDIVLFNRDRRLFAHRIWKTDASATVTRGDAMQQADRAVGDKELLGRVASITRNGKCIQPSKNLSLPQRAVAGLVRSSDFGARVVVGIHGFLQDK